MIRSFRQSRPLSDRVLVLVHPPPVLRHSIPFSERHPSHYGVASPHPSHPGSYYSYHGQYHAHNSQYPSFYYPGYHTASSITMDTPLPTSEQLSDLTREWERQEHTLPLLFRVAMDVLPVHKHMEALQVLKFSYRQDRLSFTDDLLAKEEDYTISGTLTSAAVDELMREERYLELGDLIENI